jgi:hypothetical protein
MCTSCGDGKQRGTQYQAAAAAAAVAAHVYTH